MLSNSENSWDRLSVGKDTEDSNRLSNSQHRFVKNKLCHSKKLRSVVREKKICCHIA